MSEPGTCNVNVNDLQVTSHFVYSHFELTQPLCAISSTYFVTPMTSNTTLFKKGQSILVKTNGTSNSYITSTRDVSGLNCSAPGATRPRAGYKCFVSPVAKQMTSNVVVVMRDVM